MKKLSALRNERATLCKMVDALNAKAEADGRSTLNEDEQKQFDANVADIKDLDREIARQEEYQELLKKQAPVADANVEAAKKAAEEHKPKLDKIEFSRLQTPKYFSGPDAKERAYRAGKWFLGYGLGRKSAREWCERNGVSSLTMIEGANEKGGVYVPEEVSSAIIDLREMYGIFRQNVSPIEMTSDVLSMPRRTGGVMAYFVGEGGAITASDPASDAIKLVAQKIAAMVEVSSELGEDAVISFADYITYEFGHAFAKKEDECGFLGDGTSTYGGNFGVVTKINDGNHAGSIYTAAAGNTAYGTLDVDDFIGVMGKLPQYAAMNAKWYISRAGHAASMERLAYAMGGATGTELVDGRPVPKFLGYPVVVSQVLNSTLTAQTSGVIAALFGDLSMAAKMGNRRDIRVETSTDYKFNQDLIAIKGTARFAISVHDVGDATNAGPIVALKFPGA